MVSVHLDVRSEKNEQEIFSVAGPVLGVKIVPDRNFQHGGVNYGFVGALCRMFAQIASVV